MLQNRSDLGDGDGTVNLPAVLQNRSDLGDGDGTVPKVSSIPIERSQNLDNFFIAEQYGALQNQAQVLDNLLNVLRIGTIDLEAIKGEAQAAISLSLEDLYLADEPIALRARLIGLPNSATRLKGDRPALSLDFVEQENEWVLAIEDLQPGLYRIRVRTDSSEQAPSPVHDLFEVVRN